MRLRSLGLALLLAGSVLPAASAERYTNVRFGYVLTLPDGFGPPEEADNSDGVTVRGNPGHAVLLVYGFYPLSGGFASEVASAIRGERERGWDVSYRAVRPNAASWSGAKAGRIVYVRALPLCDGAIGTFRLEYDGAAKAAFDGIVGALVRSFRATDCG
jgi:hypothetical protein